MKKKSLRLLLTITMVFALFPIVKAEAVGLSGATVTVGQYAEIVEEWAQGESDLIDGCGIDSGALPPGMQLTFTNSGYPSLVIKGTPTSSGTYAGQVYAHHSESGGSDHGPFSITVVAAPATPAPKPPAAPLAAVITKHPGGEDVKVGESAVFTAGANNYTSMTWRIVSADTKTTVQSNEASSYFSGLKVSTYKTASGREAIEFGNIPLSLNGWKVEAKFIGNDGKAVFTNGAKVGVTAVAVAATPAATPAPTPAPTPTPQPSTAPTEEPVVLAPTSAPAMPTETPEITPTPDEDTKSSAGIPWWAICLIALGVILVGVIVYALLIKPSQNTRHRSKHENQPREKINTGIRCDKCGWECTDPDNIPRFCPNCGDPIGGEDIKRTGE